MSNRLHHICYGRLVLKMLGPHKGMYQYNIYGNYGDIYKVNGTSDLLGTICFREDKTYIIDITNNLVNLEELQNAIKLINLVWED